MSTEGQELAVIEGQIVPEPIQPLTLFGTADPVEVLDRAAKVATALADVLRKRKLYATIRDRNYVTVEGWTLLGSMLGVFPQIEWTRKLEDGWEARAVATVAATGRVVGAGEAQCTRTEGTWRGRDDYALRAMAQTRAISRALRGPLDFVVKLAGYESTPSDEMPSDDQGARAAVTPSPVAPYETSLAPDPTLIDGQGAGEPVAGARTGSPPTRTPQEILDGARKHAKEFSYALEDAVCRGCGRKEFIRPYQGSFFCSKRDGGCGFPAKGSKWVVMTYGEWLEKQSK